MARNDWIPGREQDLVDVCGKWKGELENQANIAAFGWDQTEVTAALDTTDAFLAARTAYEADNSTANRLTKDDAKEETVDAMRDFANSSIRFNKKMNDTQKLVFGIHPADKAPTHHLPPASQPDTEVENTLNHFEHKVRALNHATGDTGKPEDAYGVRYAWQVSASAGANAEGEKPASGADLGKTAFSRKTTHVVTHTEAEKGHACWYATCYENSKGEAGSWSPLEEFYIG